MPSLPIDAVGWRRARFGARAKSDRTSTSRRPRKSVSEMWRDMAPFSFGFHYHREASAATGRPFPTKIEFVLGLAFVRPITFAFMYPERIGA